jgi:hypothetical protein
MNSYQNERPRTYNTEVRSPWNPVIHHALKAIDHHTMKFLETGDPWHERKAWDLRRYVAELKDWIHREEGR